MNEININKYVFTFPLNQRVSALLGLPHPVFSCFESYFSLPDLLIEIGM